MYKIHSEEIKYFLAAAECLSFTEAARRLYVSQPAITKWVKHLENELGLSLFHRTNKGLNLTPAGQYLYEKWTVLETEFKATIDEAKKLSPILPKSIKIGILYGLDHDKFLLRGINQFQQQNPDVSFNIQIYHFYEMKALANELDLLLTTSLETDYLAESTAIITEPMQIYIAMSDQNPLADKEMLVLNACSCKNIKPAIIPVDSIPSQRIFVKLNQGVTITNHRFLHEDDGIVLKKCIDFPVDIYRVAMLNKKTRNKSALAFFEMLSKLSKEDSND